jgi:anti-anti-sigma factor
MRGEIKVEKIEDVVVLHLKGLFSSIEEPDIAEELRELIKTNISEGNKKILIDFKYVELFASNAIGALTTGHSTAANAGGRIVPYNIPSYIKKGFEIVGLASLFPLCDTMEEAKAYADEHVK